MTDRERLLRALRGAHLDAVPVAPFIHINFVKAFYGDHDIDVVPRTVDVYEHFGFDIIHRNCTPAYDDIALDGPDWHVTRRTEPQGRDIATHTTVHTPEGDLTEVHRTTWVSEYDAEATPVDYFVKSESDLDVLIEYQPPVGKVDVSPIVSALEALGDEGVTAPWVQGAFNHVAYYYRRLDDLILDAMTNPEFYHRLMMYFLKRNKAICSQLIDAGADVLSYSANIACGKVMGVEFFRQHVLPYEAELIDHVQATGAAVLYHNCGCANKLLPAYNDLPMRAYESLTPPPYGDTDLEHALATFRPDIVLSGNIDQIDFLMRARPDEIRSRVSEVLGKAKARGSFILAATDYFHEQTPHDSLHAFAEAGREFGRY